MASQVTVTGKAGPGITVTAQVFSNISAFGVDTNVNILSITDAAGFVNKIGITAATTFTVTKSGSNYTVAVS